MRPIITIILFALCSCTDFDQTLSYQVDPKLAPFVDSFYAEAQKRGITLYKDNLIVRFTDNCPGCNGRSTVEGDQRVVVINRWSYDGYITDSAAIEFLVFHELGHALLYRPHNDPALSIMAADAPLRIYKGNDSLRTVLINELFRK